MRRLVVPALILVALAAAWIVTPLREVARPERLLGWAETLRQLPLAMVTVPAVFVLLGLVLFPVSVLRAVTVVVFGPVLGPLYAVTGAVLSGLVGYALGHRLGAKAVDDLAGPRARRIRERLGRAGALSIAAVRLIPLGPFTLVNAVAGAARVRLRDFTLGTFLGMTPGALWWAVVGHFFEKLLR